MRNWPITKLLVLLLCLLRPPVQAQAPIWQTAEAIGSDFSYVAATAADATGQVYLTGSFRGTVTFGTTTLTSAGNDDIFVAKWNAVTGSYSWAVRAGETSPDVASSIALNGSNVYIAGEVWDGPVVFGGTTLATSGGKDLFVAKLQDAGASASFTWVQGAGGSNLDSAYGLAVQGANLYVAGEFSSNSITFGSTTLLTSGNSDGFVAKLTDAGSSASFAWVRQMGGATTDYANAVAVKDAEIYVTGDFDSAPASFGSTSLTPAGGTDIFITKLTDAGATATFAWTQQAGGTDFDFARALAVNESNVYVAGN